jgi:hypothetical protein
MITRLLICLGATLALTFPVQAQGTEPATPPPSQSGFSSTFRSPPEKQMTDGLRYRLGSLSVNALLAPRPRLDTTAVTCPMPVLQPRPSAVGSMPVQAPDSTVAPAANKSLTLPSCSNYLFRPWEQPNTHLER